MNAKSTLHLDPVRVTRRAEIAAYAVLAALLISRLFYVEGPMTLLDVSLITLGAVFGMMAVCAASPLCALHTLRRQAASTGSGGEPLSDVLRFTGRQPPQSTPAFEQPRRAA